MNKHEGINASMRQMIECVGCWLLVLICSLFSGLSWSAVASGQATTRTFHVGQAQSIEGFSVLLRDVQRSHEAGAADYVAVHGNIFLFVGIQIRRQGSHGSYYADPQDFHVQTSRGDVIDSEEFGVTNELKARHIYTKADTGVIGFEVPASDKGLILLWQPTMASNPDAQAEWLIGTAGHSVSYYQ